MKLKVIGIFAVLLCPIFSWAITIKIPSDQPNIQAGIDNAGDGDTVLVAPGTYTGTGNRDINTGGKQVRVMSESGPEYTLISCDGTDQERHIGFFFNSGEDSETVIDGFRIEGALGETLSYWQYAAVSCSSSTPIVLNCVITNNYGSGVLSVDWQSRPYFRNCEISDNGGHGIILKTGNIELANCVISNNNLDGVNIDFSGELRMDSCLVTRNGGTGVYAYTFFEDFLIYNCTFYDNYRGLYWDFNYPKNGSASMQDRYNVLEVRGNIFAYNHTKGIQSYFWDSDDSIALCNNSYDNPEGNWDSGPYFAGDEFGNISADPMFCDTASGDFRISALSPCNAPNNGCGILMGAMATGCEIICGDVNVDGEINLLDILFLIDYVYNNPPGPAPDPIESGDVNADGNINLLDILYLIEFEYGEPTGPEPVCP